MRSDYQYIRVELAEENAAYFPEEGKWCPSSSPPTLSAADGSVWCDVFRIPQRGDIIEFSPSMVLERSPAAYGDLREVEIIGKASDELLAACDAEWDRYRTQ